MPMRQAGVLASCSSSWVREGRLFRTTFPGESKPTTWKTLFPKSIPIVCTSIADDPPLDITSRLLRIAVYLKAADHLIRDQPRQFPLPDRRLSPHRPNRLAD